MTSRQGNDLAAAIGFFGGPSETIDESVARWNAAPVAQRAAGHAAADDAKTAPASGGGSAMPDNVRSRMEHSFGADFSPVHIHQGPEAAALGALAYTQGTDIHFAPGQYRPDSPGGLELLGHELTHVVQQAQGRVQPTMQAKGVSINDDAGLEQEADAMGARAARGEVVHGPGTSVAQRAGSQPLQRMKIRGGFKAAKFTADKRKKHVEPDRAQQKIKAIGEYQDTTFVTDEALVTSIVDANQTNFLQQMNEAGPRVEIQGDVKITVWTKTEGVGKTKPVDEGVDQTVACTIGVEKNSATRVEDEILKITHFQKA